MSVFVSCQEADESDILHPITRVRGTRIYFEESPPIALASAPRFHATRRGKSPAGSESLRGRRV